MQVNVQAKTALLKGYAHSGRIRQGADLFREMCRSKGEQSVYYMLDDGVRDMVQTHLPHHILYREKKSTKRSNSKHVASRLFVDSYDERRFPGTRRWDCYC